MTIPSPPTLPRFDGLVEYWREDGTPGLGETPAGVVFICEHASNALPVNIPELGGDLGISQGTIRSHAAYDIGTLGLSRGLAARMAPACGGAVFVHAPLSRLVYDLNRAPDHLGAMPAKSELHPVPGNQNLSAANRLARLNAIAIPFHETVSREIMRLVALDRRPVVIAVHSFTPVYFGKPREVEFGVLFDDDAALAGAILDASGPSGLETRLNEPYTAKSDVAHTIRLHAQPLKLRNSMLEVRNDLIATAQGEDDIADRLAPVLLEALHNAGITPTP